MRNATGAVLLQFLSYLSRLTGLHYVLSISDRLFVPPSLDSISPQRSFL